MDTNTDAHITIISGEVRLLTREEKKIYPLYKYVTTGESKYTCGERTIEVPKGFLTDGSSGGGPDYGRSWLFHDYLYATHCFSSGEECTREDADEVMEKVLRHEGLNWYCWVFIKLSRTNPLWLFSRAWAGSGQRGAEFIEGS